MPIIIPWAEQLAEDEGVADLIMLSKQTMVDTYGSKSRDSWFIGRIHNEEYYWIAQKAALE